MRLTIAYSKINKKKKKQLKKRNLVLINNVTRLDIFPCDMAPGTWRTPAEINEVLI